jgi:hypothetical protein
LLLQRNAAFAGEPTQTLEFPVGFRGWAVVVWGQSGRRPLPSKDGDLVLRFPADGIIITSTVPPGKQSEIVRHDGASTSIQTVIEGGQPFRQRSFYINSSGMRTAESGPPVERFDGLGGQPGQPINHTLFLVAANAPADYKAFEDARRKVAQAVSRLQ